VFASIVDDNVDEKIGKWNYEISGSDSPGQSGEDGVVWSREMHGILQKNSLRWISDDKDESRLIMQRNYLPVFFYF